MYSIHIVCTRTQTYAITVQCTTYNMDLAKNVFILWKKHRIVLFQIGFSIYLDHHFKNRNIFNCTINNFNNYTRITNLQTQFFINFLLCINYFVFSKSFFVSDDLKGYF